MHATIEDLRYKAKDLLAALDRRETVSIYHKGKHVGKLIPVESRTNVSKASDHKMFGCVKEGNVGLDADMESLRGGRV